MGSVSAYHIGYAHNSHGTRFVFGFDGDFYTQDYRYVDYYGAPVYRVYGSRSDYGRHRFHDDDDFWREVNTRRAVRFLENSWYGRYRETAGQRSGDAFCQGCKTDGTNSNWGNKPAYDLIASGSGGNRDYYYRQNYDYGLQRFNWRF
jgi:hypothetical protein